MYNYSLMTSINNLSCLIESSKVINSSLKLPNILTKVTKISKDILESEAGSLMLLDENTKELIFTVALGKMGHKLKKGIKIKLGQGIAGYVAKTGKPVIVRDVNKDKRFSSAADKFSGFKTKSIMCVPLHNNNKIIGVMEAINSHHKRGFSAKDLSLFQAFACQVAVAIDNARLHKEELEIQQLNNELAIARLIQQNLLPVVPKIPEININALNIPAEQVGGDLYDFINLDNGKVGIMISDVSGKGIPAALCMVRVMSEFRSIAKTEENLGDILGRINNILINRSIMGMFVTLFYLVIDKINMKMKYTSAGHPPPLYYSITQNKTEYLDKAQNPPLGIMSGIEYKSSEINFTNGDSILLYTDGVAETLGMEKLKIGIIKEIDTGIKPHDDFTLVEVHL